MLNKVLPRGIRRYFFLSASLICLFSQLITAFCFNNTVSYSNDYNSNLKKGDSITYEILNINEPPLTNFWDTTSLKMNFNAKFGSQVIYTFDRLEAWSYSQYYGNITQPFGALSIGDLSASNVPNEEIAKNLIQFVSNYYFGFIIDLDWAKHEAILNSLKCKVRYKEELIHWNWYATFNVEYVEGDQRVELKFERNSGVLLYMNTQNSNYKYELIIIETTIPVTPIIPLFVIVLGLIFAYFTIVPLSFHYLFRPKK